MFLCVVMGKLGAECFLCEGRCGKGLHRYRVFSCVVMG